MLTCIEQGAVYHYHLNKKNKDGTLYSGDRFFIVLNVNPLTDRILVMATITTQIVNQERYISAVGANPDSLVRIDKNDLSCLSKDSAINCNQVYEISLSELIEKINLGGKVFADRLPKSVMSAIISALVQSNQVANEYKKMVI